MAKDDTLYPLQPSDDGGQSAGNTLSSPWAEYAEGNNPAANDADDYTFTEEGLEDGISVGDAKRYSPIDPKYRGEQQDNGSEIPWAKYGNQQGNNNGQFNGSTYGELEDFLKDRLNYYKSLEESDEERQKREKRERRQKSLATIGDILGAFHRGYAYQRGVQPMEIPNLSQKMQERMDKAKAERDKNSERIMNYAVTLGKLNDSKAQADYQQKTLALRQQQQDRLAQHEKTQRTIADARVKYYEAQSSKNDEQAAYWKTKADLLERGFPLQQAEQLARIEERKAHTAKLNHDANAPYKTSSSGKGSGSSSSGQQSGGTSRQRSGGTQTSQPSSNGGSYANTKKLGL